MVENIRSVIVGSGSYIPEIVVKNSDFLQHTFYEVNGDSFDKTNEEIIEKFRQITDIEERRYAPKELMTSDIGFFAAEDALKSSGIDKESLDYIIVAHNFGDVNADNRRTDILPSIASRIKHKLKIKNPYTVAYDLPFGCPGWVEGMIQANYYIRSGDAKRALIIGAETLSRLSDPHNRDSMIFSDGAGATILEGQIHDEPIGILTHRTRTDTLKHAYMMWMEESNNPDFEGNDIFIKMNGRKLYEYALHTVPGLVKECIEKAELDITDIKKILIHQANAKMDEAILGRLFHLYREKNIPEGVMPMTINKLGNNSVATVPILYDLLKKGKMGGQCQRGDHIVFASVGAGMNVNAIVYKI
jgi:3-oxoacyl-[acyl-carrier-protein] synthase-3